MATTIQIANLGPFLASVRAAQAQVGDLSVPLTAIAHDWMAGNVSIFSGGGNGWAPLSRAYAKAKEKRYGGAPMLVASGALERSMTNPSDPNAVFQIVGGQQLQLGTRVASREGAPYPMFLRSGTRRMPARDYVNVTSDQVARWQNILRAYVVSAVGQSAA